VIANLAIWFALHALFRQTVPVHMGILSFEAPVVSRLDPWAVLLAAIAAVALLRLKLGVLRTLGICAAASIALRAIVGGI
jgi:chromate transporter